MIGSEQDRMYLAVARAIGEEEATFELPYRGRTVVVTCKPGIALKAPVVSRMGAAHMDVWTAGLLVRIVDGAAIYDVERDGLTVVPAAVNTDELGELIGRACAEWAARWIEAHREQTRRALRRAGIATR